MQTATEQASVAVSIARIPVIEVSLTSCSPIPFALSNCYGESLQLSHSQIGASTIPLLIKDKTTQLTPPRTNITALILAGGAGRRVGHQDKGLITWQGKPFIAHVCEVLKPQVDDILISCNRNFAHYANFCSRTVSDNRRDFQGPLAGLEAATPFIKTELLVVVSCDMPQLPPDLVTRLTSPLSSTAADAPAISYAHDGIRAQYLCAALRRDCLYSLTDFLDDGRRAVKDWFSDRNAIAVDFSEQQSCFRNFNRLA
jgi:molybdenum cofactor guanylyltransferase